MTGAETFSRWLRRQMDERGMTQVQLAAAASTTQQTVSRWLTSQVTYLRPQHSHALGKVFGVDPAEIDRIIMAGSPARSDGVRGSNLEDKITELLDRIASLEAEVKASKRRR